jgi:hypothetical protein
MALMLQAVTSGGGALGSNGGLRRPMALLSARFRHVALAGSPRLVRDARGAPARSGAFPAACTCLRRGCAPQRAAVVANTF